MRRGLRGLATINVSVGPITRSTSTTMPTTCSALRRYQPGQRYQPRYSPPRMSVSAPLLPTRCSAKARSRNCIDLSFVLLRPPFRDGVLRRRRTLAGDGALAREPGTEIDEPTALAAERSERRLLPVQFTLARRTLDAGRAHVMRVRWRSSQGQQLSTKVTSPSAWVGRVVMPCQARKRT